MSKEKKTKEAYGLFPELIDEISREMEDELDGLLGSESVDEQDTVNHPPHYTNREHECIDEMIAVFGKEAVIAFCKCNAWKYRYRANSKGSHDEDMAKADWYISKVIELNKKE